MGHRADYQLTFLTPEGEPHYGINEKQLVAEMNDCITPLGFHFEYYKSWRMWESKWVDRDEEMRAFSKKHPDVLFLFKVNFADVEQWYHLYVLNGKIQKCLAVVTYPPFDADAMN